MEVEIPQGLQAGKLIESGFNSHAYQESYSALIAGYQPYPLYPLPLAKGKGRRFERGASAPLRHPCYFALRRVKERLRLSY